jgi:hypothetical protein
MSKPDIGATAFNNSTHSLRRSKGPIFFTGIRTSSLAKKATKRKRSAGDRDSKIGSAALSLASDFFDTPKLVNKIRTSCAFFDPLFVNNPGHVRSTYTTMELV